MSQESMCTRRWQKPCSSSTNEQFSPHYEHGVKAGQLKQAKGTGAAGSFRLGEKKVEKKKKPAKKVTKPKKPKSSKKKPAAKKPSWSKESRQAQISSKEGCCQETRSKEACR
ncbi:histone 1.1 [Plakobranchus ocellatus]|uniref:Histone 1.1 n=1 Tax=Plakobranchus ocellatus TaxID=259542 RepID=A0AAV4B774_9GAST|nr:histone 1.1 [Plakobranchus ocellatus]